VPSLSRFGLLASSAAVAATVAELLLLPATLITAHAVMAVVQRRLVGRRHEQPTGTSPPRTSTA
jgi:hypothetical protein